MPLTAMLKLPDVYRRVGVRRLYAVHTFKETAWRPRFVRGPEFGLWLAWPAGYLSVRAWRVPAGMPLSEGTEFEQGPAALFEVHRRFNAPTQHLRDYLGQAGTARVLSSVVGMDDEIHLLFCVDTDSDSFALAVRDRPSKDSPLFATVGRYAFDSASGDEPAEIRLEMTNPVLPGGFKGYVAVDLGNTSSSLAVLHGHLVKTPDVELIDGEVLGGCSLRADERRDGLTSSANSAVRVDVIDREYRADDTLDSPSAFVWSIGERALDQPSTDGVVLGAKRMMAGRDPDRAFDLMAYEVRDRGPHDERVQQELPERLPGELLLTRLFQRFREKELCQLPPLALTYPTSYSRREILQLRETACRAVARQNNKQQSEEYLEEARAQVPCLLDEASASAFYYLFKDVLETPPGLTRFRWLYPEGCNLLLYDLGGGTTDIGLVRASSSDKAPNVLTVEIRGRSGVRDFGGDDITAAAFGLLKLHIARAVSDARGTPPHLPGPGDPLKLAAALKDPATLTRIDGLVPTRYTRRPMNNLDRRNRDHTRHLWQRATRAKHDLNQAIDDKGVPAFGDKETFGDPLSEFLMRQTPPAKQPALRTALKAIRLRRADIDGLIRDRVRRSVDRCNLLLDRRLTDASGRVEEVHRFILLGNGSRYPLVRSMLADGLKVMCYDECEVFDPDVLKSSVAKGAVLALGTRLASPSVRIDFDWSLSDRLPYDVGVPRPGVGRAARWLYREGETFAEVEARPQRVEVVEQAEGQHVPTFQLVRQWPGDDDYEEYLRFEFEHGIHGAVTVEYDPVQEFRVSDGDGNVGVLADQGEQDVYLHPVERGTL